MSPAAELVMGVIRAQDKTTVRLGLDTVGRVKPAVVRRALCELRDLGLIEVNFSTYVARIKVNEEGT